MAPEAKVGALFLATVLLIAVVAVFLGQYTVGIGQYELVVHFADVKGFSRGAEVRLAGVKIGRVVEVSLQEHKDYPNRPVAVYLLINIDTNLYNTDEFVIEQSGFIGDQYLNVRRLDEKEIAARYEEDYQRRALSSHEHYAGAGVVGLTEVTERTQQLLQQANETLGQIRQTFADTYTRDQVRAILQNMNKATAKTNVIAQRVLHLIEVLTRTAEAGQPQIDETLDMVAQTATDLKAASQQIHSFVQALAEGPLPLQLALTSANIHQASENIRVSSEIVRDAVEGPEGAARLTEVLDNMAVASENIERASTAAAELAGDEQVRGDIKAALANLRAASESLKAASARTEQFLLEEDTFEDIRASLANIKTISEKGVTTVEKAQEVLDRVDNTMDQLSSAARPFRPSRADAYWDIEATEDEGLRTDLNLRLGYSPATYDYWRIGVRDIGDNETLNLQKSMRLRPRVWADVGLFNSKLGVGLNYKMTPDVGWQIEAYNPDEPVIDLRGIYRFSPEWYLTIGAADSFDEQRPFIGLRRQINLKSEEKAEE